MNIHSQLGSVDSSIKKPRGGLKKPADDFFFLVREFERLIRDMNMEELNKEAILDSYMVQHYSEKLFETDPSVYVEDVLNIFIRVRGYARARMMQRRFRKETVIDQKQKKSASLRGALKCISNTMHST